MKNIFFIIEKNHVVSAGGGMWEKTTANGETEEVLNENRPHVL